MGCASSAPKAEDASILVSRLSAMAEVEPVRVQTRGVDRDSVLRQRTHAQSLGVAEERSLSRKETRLALVGQASASASANTSANSSAKSLSDMPRSNRMSRIGTMGRGAIVRGIQQASSSPDHRVQLQRGPAAAGLDARLRALSMLAVEMEGDGNCQFRALADQLLGSQKHHAIVRAQTTAHMRAHSGFFGMYFEDGAEFDGYMREMTRSRTWGDELTLRAAVEAFGCVAHVVTSEDANWRAALRPLAGRPARVGGAPPTSSRPRRGRRYLVYTPESSRDDAALERACAAKRLAPPPAAKEVFITYISPIHYNAIAAANY